MDFLKSPPGDDPIVVEGFFAASPDQVYRAWTEPDAVSKWFGVAPNSLSAAEIDLRPGGAWRFVLSREDGQNHWFEGEYLEIAPDEKLCFSWCYVSEQENGEMERTPQSTVDVSFTPKGKGTQLKVIHNGVATETGRRMNGFGWTTSLKHLAEGYGL